MNLIGPSEMLQDVKDQSDSFYISYMRQVARKSKNMNLLAEFSWIFSMETAESEVQYNIEHMCKAVLIKASLLRIPTSRFEQSPI
jgi:predicted CopG family antitoxin